jgi:hypothetical protein
VRVKSVEGDYLIEAALVAEPTKEGVMPSGDPG